MKYILLLLVFISTKAYPQECVSLIATDQSLENKIQAIARLQNSWDCLEQLYRNITHDTPSNNEVLSIHRGSMGSVTNNEILNRISHIIYAYMSFLSTKNLNLNVPEFYPPEYTLFSLKNLRYFYTVDSVESRSLSVLNGFHSNIKNIFNRFIAQSHFFLDDYININSDSYVLKNRNLHNQSTDVPIQTFHSKMFVFQLPSFALCKNQESQNNQTSLHHYTLSTYNELVQYVDDPALDIVTLYTSILNFYHVFHNQEVQLFLNSHDILRSLPYGFEWTEELKNSISSYMSADQLQKIEKFIHLLKLHTFSQIILMADSGCHSNQFNETLRVTYLSPLDDINNPTSSSEDLKPFFEIHYSIKESSYFDDPNPSLHVFYSTSLFQKDYFQNDMMTRYCQNCYKQLENFLNYISQESEQ